MDKVPIDKQGGIVTYDDISHTEFIGILSTAFQEGRMKDCRYSCSFYKSLEGCTQMTVLITDLEHIEKLPELINPRPAEDDGTGGGIVA